MIFPYYGENRFFPVVKGSQYFLKPGWGLLSQTNFTVIGQIVDLDTL